jgi:uncharacterized lipoprotein YddW (UPF0748 family)
MIAASFSLLLSLAVTANEKVIDAFRYSGAAAAQRAWTRDPADLRVSARAGGEQGVLTCGLPFASRPKIPRVSLDRKVSLDLSAVGEFWLDLRVKDSEAAGAISLYFHSGNGWYSGGAGLAGTGWQTLRFSKAAFTIEDSPAGWDQVDLVRISVWRGAAKDSWLALRRLAAAWHDVAMVVPSARQSKSNPEYRAALMAAETVGGFLTELGLGADAVEEEALARGALGKRRLAILAYNPQIGRQAQAALVKFIDQGGKLFACYQLPDVLARRLGFGQFRYVSRQRPGQFAEIRFEASDIPGLPKAVQQASWNITTAEPAAPGARTVAHWFDGDGKPTGLPALLISDHGAFLSHIVLADDPAGKRQMLAALLGRLDGKLWAQMADEALARVERVGHLESVEALGEFVRRSKRPAAAERLDQATGQLDAARSLAAGGRFAEAVVEAGRARESAAAAYLRAQPSPEREGRAFWNHSGGGAYPGDWERTAKELSAAGFNMVIPNMLWAGLAHYPSDILPRSKEYREHGDQIAQCLAACRKHGIEVHVWKVNHNLSTAPREFVERLRAQRRTQVSHTGQPEDWLCPSHPENFALERDSMLEVARRYEVDGLHFDYIRYPDGEHCYCDGCRERFETSSGRKVARWPEDCFSGERKEEYRDWRCRQITRLVEAVSREAKRIRPGIKISAAVFGDYPECRESVGQDWVSWIKAGYLDFVCPMDYATSDLQFVNLVSKQIKQIGSRVPIYPGIGAWRLGSADRVAAQIYHARRLGAGGFTIFNLDEGAARTLLPGIAAGPGAQRAVPPHRQ